MRVLSRELFMVSLLLGVGCQPNEPVLLECVPGTTVEAGCGCNDLGSCNRDPVLVACDSFSPRQCLDRENSGSLSTNDDTCGLCPYLSVTCPASGRLTFVSRAFSEGGNYECEIGVRGDAIGMRPTVDAGP